MDTRITGQKWFYLMLGMVAFINLWFLFGRIAFSGYIKFLVLFALLFFLCRVLYQKTFLIVSFVLLLSVITPQVSALIPYVNFGGLDIHEFDVLSGGVFIYLISQLLLNKNRLKGIQQKVNNVFFLLFTAGLITVLMEIARGKGDILYPYRFFFYFIWVPVLVNLVGEHRNPIRIVHYIIIINLISVVIALGKHFINIGFEVFYLDISTEMNLFVLMILLPFCWLRKPLIGNSKTTLLIFLICLVALLIDHSRKMYVGFAFGCILLYFTSKLPVRKKARLLLSSSMAILLILTAFYFSGMLERVVSRSESIFVLPKLDKIGKVDGAVGFRIYALHEGLRIISEHPFLGIGMGESMTLLGAGGHNYYGFDASSPHNFYIQSLAGYGIPIVVLVYSFVFYLMKLSWKNIKKHLTDSENDEKIIARGMYSGFIAFIIAMFFGGFEILPMLCIWIFLGLTVAFANLDREAPLDKTTNAAITRPSYQHYPTRKTNYGKRKGY